MRVIYFFMLIVTSSYAQNSIYSRLEKSDRSFLYAPWRDVYSSSKKEYTQNKEKEQCPFCGQMEENDDEKNFILRRFKYNLVALNLFPYEKGHLLIIPLEHKDSLKNFSSEARAEMIELATVSLKILEDLYAIPGANIGLNIGYLAGASVPGHLHIHVIPRTGIKSFLYIIGNTDVVTFDFKKVYKELKKSFDELKI